MNIEFSHKTYLLLFAVFILSFVAAWLLPVPEVFKGIFTVPGIGALLGVLYQIWRDQVSYERQKELQGKQLFFNLGVTSHMASVAFDKHVQFCEEYITQINEGLIHLFREGPTEDAISLAGKLSTIRFKFRPWLTEDIVAGVLPYEKALTEIGALAKLSEHSQRDETRTKAIDRMFAIFSKVTGIKGEQIDITEEIAAGKIINHLQQVLGIQELTKLRQRVITEAIDFIS